MNARADDGSTPLMYASGFNSNPEVLIVLIKAGANVNARDDNGKTALMYAARYNSNSEVLSDLINAGADARAKDIDGKTAFDYAKDNKIIKGTKQYWELNDARYK